MRVVVVNALGAILAGLTLVCFHGCSLEKVEEVQIESDERLEYSIVVTGGELLRGVYPDLHTEFITRTLSPLGAQCVVSVSIGDDREDLLEALAYAQKNASLVIVTGGLGPTDDDVTREVLSHFTGVALEEHPALISILEERFSADHDELRGNIRRQALTPIRGRYFPNPNGTASGLVYESDEIITVALPGPPSELRPMVRRDLIPYLSERFGTRPLGASLQMRFVGIGESSIDSVIHDYLELPPDLMISSLFEAGRVDLTFSLPGSGEKEMSRLRALESQLTKHLGDYLYTSDRISLEQHVVDILVEKGVTLGIAEVGSAGAVFSSLAQVKGISKNLLGGVVAKDDGQMISLLRRFAASDSLDDAKVLSDAELLVTLVRRSLKTDFGLAITEANLREDGSSHVSVVLGSSEMGVKTREILLRGRSREKSDLLVTSVLDTLRRLLSDRD